MKLFEKILVVLWGLFFISKGISEVDTTKGFYLINFTLVVFYLFFSIPLFKPKRLINKVLIGFVGFGWAVSILVVPYLIELTNSISPYLFSFNILSTVVVFGIIIHRIVNKQAVEQLYKNILLRTFVVLVVVGFFAIRPIEVPFYRKVIIFLNPTNTSLLSNLRMFDLTDEFKEQLKLGNHEQAIKLSLASFQEGLNWLEIKGDTLTNKDKSRLWQIHGAYTNVFKAYDVKSQALYKQNRTREALYYQVKADSFLNLSPVESDNWWRNQRAQSKNEIGLTYMNLGIYDSAIYYLSNAVVYQKDSVQGYEVNLPIQLNNYAECLSLALYIPESNKVAYYAIEVLNKDAVLTDSEKKDKYCQAYLQLAYNAMFEEQFREADLYLSAAEEYLVEEKRCLYAYYKTLIAKTLHSPANALAEAQKARDCFKQTSGLKTHNYATINLSLFDIWMSLSNYDSAWVSIQESLKIVREKKELNTVRYHNLLNKEGYYYYTLGNYSEALKRLLKVVDFYRQELGTHSSKLADVLVMIGLINAEYGAFQEAKDYALQAYQILDQNDILEKHRSTQVLNEVAYIRYLAGNNAGADSLFHQAIETNIKMQMESSFTFANSVNGLGLLALRKRAFNEADSLFKKSLDIYKAKELALHPSIGINLMSQAQLAFQQKRYEEALFMLDEAYENMQPFYQITHPRVGDLMFLKGMVYVALKQFSKAKSTFEIALKAYETNFDPTHFKVKAIKKEMRILK